MVCCFASLPPFSARNDNSLRSWWDPHRTLRAHGPGPGAHDPVHCPGPLGLELASSKTSQTGPLGVGSRVKLQMLPPMFQGETHFSDAHPRRV